MRRFANQFLRITLCALGVTALLLFFIAIDGFSQGSPLPSVQNEFFGATGVAAPLGFVCTTASGTTTPLSTYREAELTNANQNPIRLNAAGRPSFSAAEVSVFLQAAVYRITLYAAGTGNTCNGVTVGAVLRTADGIAGANIYTVDFNPLIVDNVIHCAQSAGATAGAKIAACIAALPSTGGTADARGLEGAQSIAVDVCSGVTKPVSLVFGASTYTSSVNITCGSSVSLVMNQGSQVSMNTGTTITVNGGLLAPISQQIFAGAGSFALGAGIIGPIYPQWFPGASVSAKIDAAITSLGANDGVVVITSEMGTGSPSVSDRDITVIDLRGNGAVFTPSISVNTQSNGVHQLVRAQQHRVSPDRSESSVYGVTAVSGALTSGSYIGITGQGEAELTLTSAAAGATVIGVEGSVVIGSDGSTIPSIRGGTFNAYTSGTTNITNAQIITAQEVVRDGPGTITNIYGLVLEPQNDAVTRNYSLWNQGHSLYSVNTRQDGLDSGGTVRVLSDYGAGADIVIFKPLNNSAGWEWRDIGGTGIVSIAGAGTAGLTVEGGYQLFMPTATGTAPMVVTSTTPVVNLSATPTTYDAAGAQRTNTHIVTSTATLSGGTVTVTLTGAAVFSSSSNYFCTATSMSGANAVRFAPNTGSEFVLSGTGTDQLSYVCVGN